jgi:hypothetical protein
VASFQLHRSGLGWPVRVFAAGDCLAVEVHFLPAVLSVEIVAAEWEKGKDSPLPKHAFDVFPRIHGVVGKGRCP